MERRNKVALLGDLLFLGDEKGRNLSKPVGLGVTILFLEYTFVFRERKD
ncbi:hypothetical protein [Bacteroides sp.]